MYQVVYPPAIHTRFSEYTSSQWSILVSQMEQNYGHVILENDFGFESPRLKKPVTEDRRYWVEHFRLELARREKEFIT